MRQWNPPSPPQQTENLLERSDNQWILDGDGNCYSNHGWDETGRLHENAGWGPSELWDEDPAEQALPGRTMNAAEWMVGWNHHVNTPLTCSASETREASRRTRPAAPTLDTRGS